MSIWNVTEKIETAHLTQVFSGGACNILDSDGNLIRNTERDAINNWLSEQKVLFFDPQIHPDTHGVEYEFEKHSRLEIAARAAAQLDLYEISPRTFGGVTSLEIAADHFRWKEPMVIYYSDGDDTQDRIPDHSEHGYPLFKPYSIHDDEKSNHAHYREMRKNANNMRKYLVHFAREMSTLTVNFRGRPKHGDIVITSDRMHAADIFEAVVRAATDDRIFIHFPEDETVIDKGGNPLFAGSENPSDAELHALLDQYNDEGNALRQRIADLIGVNVFVRVVYTRASAVLALKELLTMKGVI